MNPEKHIKTKPLGGGISELYGSLNERKEEQKPILKQRIIKSVPIEGVGGVTEIVVEDIE